MFATPIRDAFSHIDPTPAVAASTRTADFVRDLHGLGLRRGDTVMVHSSMRAVRGPDGPGSATGGLLPAFRIVLGGEGTLVVPAYTSENSISSDAFADATAGMTVEELAAYLHRPVDPHEPVSPSMGAFAESVRTTAGAVRSDHPLASVVALGARAEEVTREHGVTHFGPGSPVARLYDIGAKVLAIGVGWGVVSAAHLAESRYAHRSERRYTCKVGTAGGSSWSSFSGVVLNDHDFPVLGRDFQSTHPDAVARGRVGAAPAFLAPIRRYVDFATAWMDIYRAPAAGDRP
ncbi:aminoglycoside N(3)-acetyltransferase [Embleya sp. NBC_00896]|uniref:aminoglycoside N(3)-acetyltransferase n=1 Tax=Embleya sp. NBC_00896 TaxID=2975961 RepID=UPI003868150B|nr:AAC(3) family N-acetyltransferase [Embleya sp. NBC_00896]